MSNTNLMMQINGEPITFRLNVPEDVGKIGRIFAGWFDRPIAVLGDFDGRECMEVLAPAVAKYLKGTDAPSPINLALQVLHLKKHTPVEVDGWEEARDRMAWLAFSSLYAYAAVYAMITKSGKIGYENPLMTSLSGFTISALQCKTFFDQLGGNPKWQCPSLDEWIAGGNQQRKLRDLWKDIVYRLNQPASSNSNRSPRCHPA